jgi:hypothetical protein
LRRSRSRRRPADRVASRGTGTRSFSRLESTRSIAWLPFWGRMGAPPKGSSTALRWHPRRRGGARRRGGRLSFRWFNAKTATRRAREGTSWCGLAAAQFHQWSIGLEARNSRGRSVAAGRHPHRHRRSRLRSPAKSSGFDAALVALETAQGMSSGPGDQDMSVIPPRPERPDGTAYADRPYGLGFSAPPSVGAA